MKKTIQKPTNDYDVAGWNDYYSANPGMHRSVGAEGDNEDPPEIDLENPAVQAAIRQAVDAATQSVKANNDSLVAEKRDLQKQLKKFDGIDLEKITKLQERFENDEEAQLIADGKMDEVISRRTERMRTDMTTQLDASRGEVERVTGERDGYKKAFENERINNQIRIAAEKAGVLPEAIEDVTNRANGVFTLDDEGRPIARDGEGNLIMSKDGKSILGPAEFVEGLKEVSPYYWPQSNSGRAAGGKGTGGSSDIEARMQAAINSGDMKLYRKLRQERNSANA